MKKPRLFLFGGFLGSGKTTLLVELGSRLTAAGASVAVITNDQGEYLVDTDYARSAGIAVGEVLKGCFCCNFTDFINNIEEITRSVSPDYILAEPVGSCTDLTATVVNPFSLYHRELATLCGFYVLADGPRILGEYGQMNLVHPVMPREVPYIASAEGGSAPASLQERPSGRRREAGGRGASPLPESPGTGCSPAPLKAARGSIRLPKSLNQPPPWRRASRLSSIMCCMPRPRPRWGWYNGRFEVLAQRAFIPADLASALILSLKARLGKAIVHAKLLAATELGSLKLSLVSGRMNSDSALPLSLSVPKAACALNIRAAVPPERICAAVRASLEELKEDFALSVADYLEDALIPAPPRPTHRIDREGKSLQSPETRR